MNPSKQEILSFIVCRSRRGLGRTVARKFSIGVIPCLIEHPCSPTLIKYDESGLISMNFKNNNQQKNLNKIGQAVTEWQTFQFLSNLNFMVTLE